MALAADRLKPTHSDLTMLRESPLSIDLYCGSVLQSDYRVISKDYDAYVCTEVIEHLFPDQLDRFARNLFGCIRPKILILTTPNADFNCLFPDPTDGTQRRKFRDEDHKFEWTRKEFELWCMNALEHCKNVEYDVEFTGVGVFTGKKSRYDEKHGYCTQAAIFKRKEQHQIIANEKELELAQEGDAMPYEHVTTISYPFFDEEVTSQQIFEEVKQWIPIVMNWGYCFEDSKDIEFKYEYVWKAHRIRQICKGDFQILLQAIREHKDGDCWKENHVVIPSDSELLKRARASSENTEDREDEKFIEEPDEDESSESEYAPVCEWSRPTVEVETRSDTWEKPQPPKFDCGW